MSSRNRIALGQEESPVLRRLVRALARAEGRLVRWDALVAAAFPDAILFTDDVRVRLEKALDALRARGVAFVDGDEGARLAA